VAAPWDLRIPISGRSHLVPARPRKSVIRM
jgi:hypothetical protein